MHFSTMLTTQLPSQFAEQLFLGLFRAHVLCNGIFLNRKQVKTLEKIHYLSSHFKSCSWQLESIFLTSILNKLQTKSC